MKDNEMIALKRKAEELAVDSDSIEWFTSDKSASVIGIDWVGEDIYIIDPQSPDWPQIEIAQFEGIDQLFKPEED
jgi:hypothetical protein